MIHIGSSISGRLASSGWKQNSPLVWIILGTWSDSNIETLVRFSLLKRNNLLYQSGEKIRPISLRDSRSSVIPEFSTTFSASSALGSQPVTLLFKQSQSPPYALHHAAGAAAPFCSTLDFLSGSYTMKFFSCPLPIQFRHLCPTGRGR